MVEISDAAAMEMTVSVSTERLPVLQREPWNNNNNNSYVVELASSSSSGSSSSSSGLDHVRYNNKSKLGRGGWNSDGRLVTPPPSQERFRRKQAKKEILRRALTPPVKRPTLRWLDFRPTPSRLRVMSTE
ncbi:OLC1v1022916C1 [Oldenlandia corymbosa var. corymbosa]|uniref:OLC1v1022916C1 n=1 Tax=Oldenlandia corymbosa var. corymbosa TaxID=529605 RepID=A0AAV1BZ08_OLDCO|nr:OLC1v1022916C1 [Oldenlandia corymbosa var. corymbosa]